MKEKKYLEEKLSEYKSIYESLLRKYQEHRDDYNRNPDSIKALEQVKIDEGGNTNYYCGTLWGQINTLEDILEIK